MAHIKTYARIKPSVKPSKLLDHESNNVTISVPQLQPSGQTRDRTATLTHQFGFSGVFGPTSTQDEVFDAVASHIVDGFLSGYNGTIFAYGQTGSGKTYTIEGGAKSYSDRGLAPRALSRIYKSLENEKFDDLSIKVSYLEIYQEVGYDLLNPTTRPGNVVTHLPKVSVTEGPNNSCMVRNLSMHLAADERVAQSLLLQGQANRKVAETPMNQRSSRSHAVFTIYIKARQKGSHAVNKSKLHLVDLAGSERVAKTKIAGQQLHEAKSINLSLHHLEGVIIALQGGHGEGTRVRGRRRALSAGPVRNRRIGSASSTRSLPYHRSMSMGGNRHIPYRNSLLTMVLRDSLGGNCLTAMIATISAEAFNLSESLSTCRFAMRVAAVQNKISRNEIIDDKTIIERLRKKIASLEEEIRVLKSRITPGGLVKNETSHKSTPHHHPSDSTTSSLSSLPSVKAPSLLADTPMPVVKPANGSGLTGEGRQLCARIMQGFVSGRVTDPVASGVSDFSRFRECLRILREMIHRSYAYHQRYNPTLPSEHHPGSKVQRSEEHVPDVKRSPEGDSLKVKSRSNNEKGSSRGYKSPFERKRDKEISRLSRNVETQIAEQKKQRKDLMEFKTLLKQQQLQNVVRDLSNKISMTSSHLEKQQELVENLRQCKASREQITAERVAEKQLAKRLAKYEKRYELAQEHLQIVRNHMELQDRVTKARQSTSQNSYTREDFISQSDARTDSSSQSEVVCPPPGQTSPPRLGILQGDDDKHPYNQSEVVSQSPLEDDHSGSLTDRIVERCRHKSGKVNARRVLDILQQEDSKHSKVAKEIKKERIKNFSQHFALKEEATLTKLQHFKEQLRKQQEAEKGKGDSELSRRRSCSSHLNRSWSDDIRTERSTTSQSEALVPTVGESDFVSSKAHSPDQSLSNNNHIAIQDLETNTGAAGVKALHSSDEWLSRSPSEKSLQLSLTKTAGNIKDSISQRGETAAIQSSDFTLGSIASMQSSLSPTVSTLHSSPSLVRDTESCSHEQTITLFDQDSLMPAGHSSAAGLSCPEDGPTAGHSAASLFHKLPGSPEQPLGQTVTDPRGSSFDEALSSMLHRDGSKVKSAVPEVGKPRDHGDVTSTLKSKLLDYLGGKPLRGPSVSSMNSLQDDWSRSSLNSGFTGSSVSTAFTESSLNSAFTGSLVNSTLAGSSMMSDASRGYSVSAASKGSSVNSAFEVSSNNSAFDGSSANSSFTGSSISNASTWTEDFTSHKTGHTSLEGRGMKSNSLVSAKPPNFQLGASRSTLNSIGEEDSILGRGGGGTNRDIFQSNQSICSVDSREVFDIVRSEVKAMEEAEGQRSYLSAAKENKERIEKIRKAISSAEVIQRAWKKYRSQKK